MRSEISQEADTQQQSAIPSTLTASRNHENHLNSTTIITSSPLNNSPHDSKAILKEKDNFVDKSSIDRLNSDLLLNKKEKKYWVQKAAPGNSFMVPARDFVVTHGDVPHYWRWNSVNETSDIVVDVAELIAVCWLDVRGKFEMAKLTPGIKYEVVFVVMMKSIAYGWNVPVNIKLTLPQGNSQEHKENLMEKPRSKWFEIPAGEFIVDAKKGGWFEFAIYEYEGGSWKRGLVVKGAAIRPKL